MEANELAPTRGHNLSAPRVSFYLPSRWNPDSFLDAHPDADWALFMDGRSQAVPHTFLRLQERGHDVLLTDKVPQSGIVVVYSGDMPSFLKHLKSKKKLTIISVESDRRIAENSVADFVVQHNGLNIDNVRRIYIPNWPQVGLIPRDTTRLSELRTVHYKGNIENLHPSFLTADWESALHDLDMKFVVDADITASDWRDGTLGERIRVGSTSGWRDYSENDVILAVRPRRPRGDRVKPKPAVKLVNAWRAGTPALLGPEPNFQELRRTELDFIEVSSPSEAYAALYKLKENPSLYLKMIQNGLHRGQAFSNASITQLWEDFLFQHVRATPRNRSARSISVGLLLPRRAIRLATRRLNSLKDSN